MSLDVWIDGFGYVVSSSYVIGVDVVGPCG